MQGEEKLVIKTPICDLLGIEHPIILAGMGYAGDAGLCAAVSNAGGFGLLGSGNLQLPQVGESLEKIRSLTDKPFGVNLFMKDPMAREKAKVAADMGVKAFFTGIGNPGPVIDIIREAGALCIPTVAAMKHAKSVLEAGVDALVCEGSEGGGHIGNLGTVSLLPQVTSETDLPVVAAGGFGDGRGLVAALALGAQGLYLGTRFLACKESPVHRRFKEMLVASTIEDTTVTGHFTGFPMRCMANDFTREWQDKEKQKVNKMMLLMFGAGKIQSGLMMGNIETGSLPAGLAVGFIKKEESAAEIIESIVSEARETYRRIGPSFEN